MSSIDVRILPMRPNLGRHVEHDERSRAYSLADTGATPASVTWHSNVPVLDQNQLGSCTGNAAVGCLGFDPYFVSLAAAPEQVLLDETLAVKVYSSATNLDSVPGSYPPTDTGSTGVAAAKALQQLGLITGYQHAFTLNAALNQLAKGPVIVGTNWYESMFTPDTSGLVSIPYGSSVAGGHEYVLYGLDMEQGVVSFRNSWGTSWGRNGDFTMTVATFQRLLLENGDVTSFVPLTAPKPTPAPAPGTVDADVLAAYKSMEAALVSMQAWAKRNGM